MPIEDRGRQREEEDLQLRHQPRQHAEAEIEQEAEGDERRGDLHRERETRAPPPGWRGSPRRRVDGQPAGRQERVAVADRRDGEMVQVGREDQRDARGASEDCRSTPAAPPMAGSTVMAKARPELLRDRRSRPSAERRRPSARASPMRSPISDLADQDRRSPSRRRAGRGQERARQRKQHEREEKREGEARPRRDELLADARHEHHQRADPREGRA